MKYVVLGSALFLSACSSHLKQADVEKASISPKETLISDDELITANAIKRDLAYISSLIDSVHPEPGFSMNVPKVQWEIEKLSDELSTPMSKREAWKYISQLNPLFNDGHMVIANPDALTDTKQHLESGGRLFPVGVVIDKSKRLYVTDLKGVRGKLHIGDEITSINGISSIQVINEILNRMHGDSLEHRMALASSRFSKMYRILFGDSGNYRLELTSNNAKYSTLVSGSHKLDIELNPELAEIVQRKILDHDIGYLKIDRFYYSPEQEQPFFEFMNESWAEFHDKNIRDVIIDVRDNPGGTDHYWMHGIAPFIANKAFPFLSGFKARLTERNLRLGPMKGEVNSIVEGPFDMMVPASNDNPNHIPGKAYLLMGPLSYSSTNLFLTALQDSKQAIVVGQNGGARSCTTGRIETKELPGSKLELTLPTVIFTRPSGIGLCKKPITPDIDITDEPSDPAIAVNSLVSEIISRR